MIYRFIVSSLLGSSSVLLFCTACPSKRMTALAIFSPGSTRFRPAVKPPAAAPPLLFWLVPLVPMLAGGMLVLPSFLELIHTGATYEHWSRFIGMFFFTRRRPCCWSRACWITALASSPGN
jgi:hypothetical protein